MFSFVYHLLLLLTTNRQETNQTKFYLFTRENSAEPLPLNDTNIHLINKSKEFKYIIHGWKGSYTGKYMVLLKDAYLQRGDYNVVQVDWSNLSDQLYPTAVENTVSVGNDLANFIEKTLVKPERVHIIGFSLGAHIAGVAGDRLKRKQYFLNRITGLDPAGPIFASDDYPIEDRLDRDDAAVVDVIHTDAGKAGFPTALGKMDFYPNGGTSLQPGCFDIENTLDTIGCSHIRSAEYFAESINSDKFKSTKCGSYQKYLDGFCENNTKVTMGENVDLEIFGKFYLTTNSKSPYAMK